MRTNKFSGFSRAFWTANIVELLERGAYYGVFIALTLYLSRILAFSDVEAATIAGSFSAGLYFLPTFSGAYADKIGFKNALLLAFSLLTLGYFGMGIFPGILEGAGFVVNKTYPKLPTSFSTSSRISQDFTRSFIVL